MSTENGGQAAPTYQELEECLRLVTQSLAWHCHGECRGFHPGKLMRPTDAQQMAKDVLARINRV